MPDGASVRVPSRDQVPGTGWVQGRQQQSGVVATSTMTPALVLALQLVLATAQLSMEDVDTEEVALEAAVQLQDGLVVTVTRRPARCLRQAAAGDQLTVHYTGRLGGSTGEVFDTSLKPGWPPYR